MAVTASLKKTEIKNQGMGTKKQKKCVDKTRPITATLEHPLILDIQLLKRLDMTTFTKRGLIALSKFCGISLITKGSSKRKLTKLMKVNQNCKKPFSKECAGIIAKSQNADIIKSESLRCIRKPAKIKIPRLKPRVNFKIVDLETNWQDDSADVVCKKHGKPREESGLISGNKLKPAQGISAANKKITNGDILNRTLENIPKPCKSCSRPEHPERLHSHPKVHIRITDTDKAKNSSDKMGLEERFKTSLTTKDVVDGRMRKNLVKSPVKGKNSCATGLNDPNGMLSQKPLLPCSHLENSDENSPVRKSPKAKTVIQLRVKSLDTSAEVTERKSSAEVKVNKKSSTTKLTSPADVLKFADIKSNSDCKIDRKSSPQSRVVNDAFKYITGCYICGSQITPDMRMKHEKECIKEWRVQNSLVSIEDRKPEPVRPDYRFTASGDLDCKGTFESIWANHMDSLVPCKKCGRKFFPDRIERHENCCNTLPLHVKYKH